ncbi:MAG: hypothetical protein J5669_01940 [Bacteroidales bacterium]|nr:hypothetical protein [Bacteroidales bacterium]
MRPVLCFLAALLACFSLCAQTPIVAPDWSTPTLVSPEYFGPNAFPVPDMSEGVVKPYVYAEIAADYYKGRVADGNDHTWDAFVRLSVPLGKRVSFEVWGPVAEHWSYSPAVAQYRRVTQDNGKRWDSGDIYVGTNILIVKGKANTLVPDFLARAVLKTAMGNTFEQARFYDAAGYFFDGTVSWSRNWGPQSYVRELRAGLSGGFLCWQDGLARQNDAVMFGLMARLVTWGFDFTVDYSGYIGWQNDGDRPRRLRLRLDGHLGRWLPFVQYTHGFKNYPFDGVRVGLGYAF